MAVELLNQLVTFNVGKYTVHGVTVYFNVKRDVGKILVTCKGCGARKAPRSAKLANKQTIGPVLQPRSSFTPS